MLENNTPEISKKLEISVMNSEIEPIDFPSQGRIINFHHILLSSNLNGNHGMDIHLFDQILHDLRVLEVDSKVEWVPPLRVLLNPKQLNDFFVSVHTQEVPQVGLIVEQRLEDLRSALLADRNQIFKAGIADRD